MWASSIISAGGTTRASQTDRRVKYRFTPRTASADTTMPNSVAGKRRKRSSRTAPPTATMPSSPVTPNFIVPTAPIETSAPRVAIHTLSGVPSAPAIVRAWR